MKYSLDHKGKGVDEFKQNLLFWLTRYVKYKLSSISNKELFDKKALASVNFNLTKGVSSIEELDGFVKQARNAGMSGINTYFNPLKKIYEVLCFYELESLKEIDEELLSEVLASTTGSLSDATKKNYRIAVINFFGYLDKQNGSGGSSHNFGIELKNWGGISGYSGTKLPEYMSEEELLVFLKAVNEVQFKTNTHRNKLIIKIIIYTGIRVSEALNLKHKDLQIDGDVYVIRIRGKGNKYRIVMIKRHLIDEDLSNLETNYLNKDGYLFVNKKGTKLTQAYVSRLVEQILFKNGIRKEKNGAHMLRHTFATMLYKKQKDLVLVQEALGHASLNTSRIYTHFDNERLKKVADIAEELSES
ncbi:MAG: tyrosine-type recombinase/integrase [Campylobacter sp.]|nr:tyrosine-type recombinase/integrase [Campylobacter sp.]